MQLLLTESHRDKITGRKFDPPVRGGHQTQTCLRSTNLSLVQRMLAEAS
jgi:hypothetical protein